MPLDQFLTVTDPLGSADAIVVLGGDGSNFARTRHGVHLFLQGYAPTVVLIVGPPTDEKTRYTSAQQSLVVAQRLGLPTSATFLLWGATSTYDEALTLNTLARRLDWRALIIVTDRFHTRRAGRTFRTILYDRMLYLSAAPNSRYDARPWWRSRDSLSFIVRELAKLAYYWVVYDVDPVDLGLGQPPYQHDSVQRTNTTQLQSR